MANILYILKNTLFFLLLTTPFIAYFIKYKYQLRLRFVFPITCLIAYLLIIGTAWAISEYLNAILQSFDLNNNGFFEDNEITPTQQIALQRVANDTGRALAPFIGLVVAPIGVGVCFGLCAIIRAMYEATKTKNDTP
ncbi:hypothetical protein LU293_04640 [Moraxella nasovis]|uniref:hypothetical protein n=1 Tax=Moraxella nasovis TaxID=2904121 RepID=UPI001F6067F2|nr:hypothetical protein [Moraxella nasovis]UNU74184.1 hypothetical protein LU293_04640 [Moraxella nasovis]